MSRENYFDYWWCEQQRYRSACASAFVIRILDSVFKFTYEIQLFNILACLCIWAKVVEFHLFETPEDKVSHDKLRSSVTFKVKFSLYANIEITQKGNRGWICPVCKNVHFSHPLTELPCFHILKSKPLKWWLFFQYVGSKAFHNGNGPKRPSQAPRWESVAENYFVYFSTKTYVVGTQKNHLDETVLLSTQNTRLNWWIRK